MATFVIGDVQGCLQPLQALLEKIHYQANQDQLWFTGDLVNRGPHSLETLQYIRQLPPQIVCVLGNHDLALLAMAEGIVQPHPQDTLDPILRASPKEKALLMHWLKNRPILHHDPILQYTLTHAGIYPGWTLPQAQALAQELEAILRGPKYGEFLRHMYGNEPTVWDERLTGWDRARFITNAFTRMRFCTPSGALNLSAKGKTEEHPEAIPWFLVPERKTQQNKLIFGHWAALNGKTGSVNVYALDTGCVWGNCLTAFCLESQERISVNCNRA